MAHQLVVEKLIACANIIPQMESIYEWKGKVESSNECVLILKTSDKKSHGVVKRVEELHEYEVPCIIALPIEIGSRSFVHWVENT